ncbi:MAG: hypothetical protein AAF283_01535 [Cyanobacteria bacterium P01_A01_bin.70]
MSDGRESKDVWTQRFYDFALDCDRRKISPTLMPSESLPGNPDQLWD